jgi:DNA-directed RNA polymerase subunit beta
MKFVEYNLAKPAFDVRECQTRGLTFASAVRAKVQLIIYDRESSTQSKVVKEVKEQEVYMGEVPLMTDKGSFIINGTERVIVSSCTVRLACSSSTTRARPTARASCCSRPASFPTAAPGWTSSSTQGHAVLPRRPSPQDAGHDPAQGHRPDPEQILANFFVNDNFRLMDSGAQMEFVAERLKGEVARFDITDKSARSSPRTSASPRATPASWSSPAPSTSACPKTSCWAACWPRTSSTRHRRNHRQGQRRADRSAAEEAAQRRRAGLQCIYTNELDQGAYISQTLRTDETADEFAARVAIYRMMRPGEPPTEDAVQALFQRLFYNADTYDLSRVGRMKFNAKIGRDATGPMVLSNEDILAVVKILVELRNGRGEVDDIDHLGNRRVRCVGELAENQYRTGLARIEKAVKERLGQAEQEP